MCEACNWQLHRPKKWVPLLYAPEIGKGYRILFEGLNIEAIADLTFSGWKNLKSTNGSSLTLNPELITHWMPL